MPPKPPHNLLAGEGDPTALFAATLDHFGAEAAAGSLTLRVPPTSRKPLEGPKRSGLHHTPELFFQLSGVCRFVTPERTFRLTPGQAAVMPPLVAHQETVMRQPGEPFANVVVMFERNGVSLHLAAAAADGTPVGTNGRLYAPRRPAIIRTHLSDVVDASHRRGGAAAMTARGAMLATLGHIREALDRQVPDSAGEHPKVTLCRSIVATHLSNPDLNVRELARRVGCSADYLSNLFHTQTGARLSAWLNAQRIDRAAHLLEESTLNVSEIAWATGYRDPSYLARRFRAVTGLTPREYRVQHTLTKAENATDSP